MEVETLVSPLFSVLARSILIIGRGCVTPRQIENIVDQIGGLEGLDLNEDLDILDGYDELPDWAQEKIKVALQNGHVADEDWKGVSRLCSTTNFSFVDYYRNLSSTDLVRRASTSELQRRRKLKEKKTVIVPPKALLANPRRVRRSLSRPKKMMTPLQRRNHHRKSER